MPFVQAKCTNCGGILEVDNSKEAAICPYCNTAYIVEKAIHNYNITTNNTNYINAANVFLGQETADKLAETGIKFLNASIFAEAYKCFKKIEENYPSDYRGPWGMLLASTHNFDAKYCFEQHNYARYVLNDNSEAWGLSNKDYEIYNKAKTIASSTIFIELEKAVTEFNFQITELVKEKEEQIRIKQDEKKRVQEEEEEKYRDIGGIIFLACLILFVLLMYFPTDIFTKIIIGFFLFNGIIVGGIMLFARRDNE